MLEPPRAKASGFKLADDQSATSDLLHVGVPSKWCLSRDSSERGVFDEMSMDSSRQKVLRRSIEYCRNAHSGQQDLVSRHGTPQGIHRARLSPAGLGKIQRQRPRGRKVFPESRVAA